MANGAFSPVITKSSVLSGFETITPTYFHGQMDFLVVCFSFVRTLCKPILKLFHLSISSSFFPTTCKDSFIISLHKKGAKVDFQNYRYFSKLAEIPKTFELIITSHWQHLCSSLISTCQHGFDMIDHR